ncbi:MAG TPA: helicase-related protein, partial [Candidatus Nanoarchaeia archaeon]|nr:helicase-related protein [Candidatus Nanoarchaeia archaeon]
CLIFVGSKKSAEKTAEDIAKSLKKDKEECLALAEEALDALSRPTNQCERLANCLKRGIAFHHAGLSQKQKDLIEEHFRKGGVRIICSTPTLAYGVDTPAYRSIIKDTKRFSKSGMSFIPVLDYLQMAGRAGRPNYDSIGEAILIASTEAEKDELIERYIKGEPEEIYSKLAVEPVLRTYVLSLIAANFTTTKKQLMEFFSRTFYAHQFQDLQKIEMIIEKMLYQLEEWEFIMLSGKKEDFVSANEVHEEKIKATILGKRVAELYLDPLTAHFFIACLREASDRKLHAFSFLQMISHTLEMRPLLRVKVKEYDAIQQGFLAYHTAVLEKEPSLYDPEYDDYLASIKTSLMFLDWAEEKTEEYLLEQYDVRPGELSAKLATADWLLYANEEIAKILSFHPILKEISKMRFRLRYGAKEELLALLRLEGIGRVRARILFNNRIRDLADIKSAPLQTLKQLLGEKVALSLKKQVGEDVEKVPDGKRKGQVSLRKFG